MTDPKITAQFIALKKALSTLVDATEKCVIAAEALGGELYPDPGKPAENAVMNAAAFCAAEPISVEQKQNYRNAGHSSRASWLAALATEYPAEAVYSLASMLGPSEDFDGLISALETIADFE